MLMDDQLRFVSDFASELLRLNRTALHLFIDKAVAEALPALPVGTAFVCSAQL